MHLSLRRIAGHIVPTAMLALPLLASVAPAQAQTYPAKPIHFVVPYAPGGVADIAARIVGQKITEAWGQQVVVDNRPGGNGFIGVTTVSKAAPDGYTILVGTAGEFTINPAIFKDMPYDVARDLIPITMLSDTPVVLAVNNQAPFKTVAELITAAKAAPGKISVATPGNGSINHLALEWLNLNAGIKLQHIPYKGGGPAGAGLAANDTPLGMLAISSVSPHVKSGRISVLALATAKRSPFAPDWGTLQEAGVKDIDISNWTAMFAPKGTPKEIVDKLNAEVTKILDLPDVKERLAAGGASTVPMTTAQLDARVKKDAATFKDIAQKANIQPD